MCMTVIGNITFIIDVFSINMAFILLFYELDWGQSGTQIWNRSFEHFAFQLSLTNDIIKNENVQQNMLDRDNYINLHVYKQAINEIQM